MSDLCAEGLEALATGRLDDFEEVASRLATIPRDEVAGTPEEIREALSATTELHEALGRVMDATARQLRRVSHNRQALRGYRTEVRAAPRAVDLSV